MKLFEPITLRNVEFPNRVWVPPMCMYSARDGAVGQFHVAHHGAFAAGGAGLIIAEATGVVPDGRISIGCPGMWDDRTAESWRPVVDIAHQFGAKIGIQLNHAGRKGTQLLGWQQGVADPDQGGWQTAGPSDNAFPGYPAARALAVSEIDELVAAWAAAAQRAASVGFDAIEIHSAHGYLLHQFLSPLVNERTDEYGGSFDNRIRFLIRVATAIRAAVSVPLLVRLSATDWPEGGWDIAQSIELCRRLKDIGVDLIDVSSGGAVPAPGLKPFPNYQVELATAIRSGAQIPTSAVGLITEAQQAADIVEDGLADVVMIGRGSLRNPHWPWWAAEQLGVRLPQVPPQYERARVLH